jgi:hypothetical protein
MWKGIPIFASVTNVPILKKSINVNALIFSGYFVTEIMFPQRSNLSIVRFASG